jgi:hypothetical protein
MAFEALINIKMNEEEIFDRAVVVLQKHFYAYQDVNVVLELGEAFGHENAAQCAVKAIKYYSHTNEKDVAAKREYIFHGEFYKVYLITKYIDKGFYIVDLFGHFTTKHGDIFSNQATEIRIVKWDIDRGARKMLPFEVLHGAFGEIQNALSLVPRKKSS